MPPPRARTRSLVLGVDLGATKVLAGLVDPSGRVVATSDRRVHRNDGPKGVAAAVLSEVAALTEGHERPGAAGVAVAGQVDAATGRVLYAPNLRWRMVPLGRVLAEALRLPVRVENDVRAATWGEWKHGRSRGRSNLLCIYIGTGVGGGIVSDGRLLSGAVGAAGEIGHLTVVAGGRPCSCPNRGCFEAYASGWAIAARAAEAIRRDPRGPALAAACGGRPRPTATDVTAAARAGDRLAVELMTETERYCADGIVGLVNVLNPERVLLGGGVLEGWPGILRAAREAVAARCQPPAARAVRVERASLGPMASVIGAAWLARAGARRRTAPT